MAPRLKQGGNHLMLGHLGYLLFTLFLKSLFLEHYLGDYFSFGKANHSLQDPRNHPDFADSRLKIKDRIFYNSCC